MKLLLIEDEEGIRRAMKVHIARDGHAVEAVGTLQEARDLLESQSFDGIVSDLKLPDGQSINLLEAYSIPAVLMSGYAVFDDAVHAMRLGCVDFLTKPVPKEALLRAVARLRPQGGKAMTQVCRAVEHGPLETTWLDCESGQTHAVRAEEITWADRQQIQAAWQPPVGSNPRVRQIDAELCQLVDAGRLIRNQEDSLWRWFLPLTVPLPDTQHERRDFIRSLADRLQETSHGLFVEVVA